MRKKSFLWILCMAVGSNLTGCKKETGETQVFPTIRIAVNSYQGRIEDLNEVSEAMSEWTEKEIGCSVELLWKSSRMSSKYSYFSQKENADIFFLGSKEEFKEYGQKEMLLDMEPLISDYGKGILEVMGCAKEDLIRYGGIYGIPKPLHEIYSAGIMIAKEYAEKYEMDLSQIHHMEDMEPFLEVIQKKEPEVIPIVSNVAGNLITRSDPIGDRLDSCIAIVRYDDPELKVENYYATEEYEERIRMIRRWQQKGYIDPEAMLQIEVGEDLVSSGMAFATEFVIRPDEVQYAKNRYGDQVQIIPFDEKPHYNRESDWGFLWAISSSTPYPKEAMKMLNLMYSDQTINDFLLYGIEGKHYIVNEDGTFSYPEGIDSTNVGYFNDSKWAFNRTIASRWEGTSENIQQEMENFNQSAITSYADGFSFDNSAVEEEMKKVKMVLNQYTQKFGVGVLDIDTHYPEFLKQLEKAGAKNILDEVQRQLDQWKNNKKEEKK